jgi:hypothetical protein
VGLSEASVKRVFSERRFTLARLEDFCRVLEIDFFELAKLARGRAVDAREMSEKQETALANDARLLGVFYLLLSDWTASEILASYEISQADLTRLLVRLDRLALVDLLPRGRVRVKVPRLLRLHPGGPIHRVHGKRVVSDFVAAEFDRIGGYFRFEYRELSKVSYEMLRRKLERISAEFLELAELDSAVAPKRRETTGILLAMRPWALSLVTGLELRAGKPNPARPARSP